MSDTTPPAVSEAMRERIEDILRDDPCGQKPSWENANRIVDEVVATTLAEARAEGRRQGLEEAATKAEGQLAYWRERMRAEKCIEDGISEDGQAYTPIGDVAAWEGGYCNGRMGEAEWWIGTLRSLATPPETQKPETGESRP